MRPLLFFPPHRFIPLKRSIEREDYPIIDDKRSRVKILNFPDGSNRNTKIPIDSCCAQVLRDSLRKILNPTFKIRLPKPFQKNFPLRVRESQFATLYPGNREEREEDEWTGFHAKFQREVALSRDSKYHRFLCRRFCATYRYTYHGAKNPKGGERKEKKTEYRPKRGQQAVLGRRGAQEWGRGLLVAG